MFKATLFEFENQEIFITEQELLQGCNELAKLDNVLCIAYAKHDKDEIEPGVPKPVHFHVMIRTQKVTTSKFIVKFFKHNGVVCNENMMQKSKHGSYCKMVQYLTHKNDESKHQYDYDTEVHKIKGDIDVYYKTDLDVITKQRNAFYPIDWTFQKKSYCQQLLEMSEFDFGSGQVGQANRIRCCKQLDFLYNQHLREMQSKGVDRNMNVIYITGESGTGKTTVAKFIAKSLGYDICISSSSNDPMQDYVGQKCLILDEFRQSDWQLSDLLKMLDNHTTSTIKSRYNNKYMNDCKLIIITSVFPVTDSSYKNYDPNNDKLVQLYRRINSYVVVSKDTYVTYEKINANGTPGGLSFTSPNPAKELGDKGVNILFEALAKINQEKLKDIEIEQTKLDIK